METKEIKNYILLMLGSPCVKIELDESQMDRAIEVSKNIIETYRQKSYRKDILEVSYNEVLKELSLAYSKEILGRIRMMFNCTPEQRVCGLDDRLDGSSLLKESREDKEAARDRLFDLFPTVPEPDEDPIFLTALSSVIVDLEDEKYQWSDNTLGDEEIAKRVVNYATCVASIARGG